jgi:hypothetical protein
MLGLEGRQGWGLEQVSNHSGDIKSWGNMIAPKKCPYMVLKQSNSEGGRGPDRAMWVY